MVLYPKLLLHFIPYYKLGYSGFFLNEEARPVARASSLRSPPGYVLLGNTPLTSLSR